MRLFTVYNDIPQYIQTIGNMSKVLEDRYTSFTEIGKGGDS